MLIKKPAKIPTSELTSETAFINRRSFLKKQAILGSGLWGAGLLGSAQAGLQPDDSLTPENVVTSYNNFYEFGTGKGDPVQYAHEMNTDPWTVKVSGEANKTGKYAFEDVVKGLDVEERIYRFRCVEAWSMVVPWNGVALRDILRQLEPKTSAKFVEFKTLVRPSEMRGQRAVFQSIDWPYTEGLRLDEAYHPLAIMALGVYGKDLPNQNGAPWRLMVPWKYGFKSVKSIVGINFTSKQPRNSWNVLAPHEYGFYANVNPAVSHPQVESSQ